MVSARMRGRRQDEQQRRSADDRAGENPREPPRRHEHRAEQGNVSPQEAHQGPRYPRLVPPPL